MSIISETTARLRGSIPEEIPQSTCQPSIYESLDESKEEFRLLTLHPPLEGDSTLRCTLRPVAFLAARLNGSTYPPYEALSYVWGQPDFSSAISVNNQEFHITPSLATILSSLRHDDNARTLWVDAICINQKDLVERAQQVRLMHKVYSSCQRVLAWIGPTIGSSTWDQVDTPDQLKERIVAEQEAVAAGMRLLRKFVEDGSHTLASLEQDYKKRRAGMRKQPPTESNTLMLSLSHEIQGFEAFLKLAPYWMRIWVVQELSYAPQVILTCGEAELDWTHISTFLRHEPYFDAFHTLNGAHDTVSVESKWVGFRGIFARVKVIEDQRRQLRDTAVESPDAFLDILTRFRDKKAAEPRDKIYALLGLLHHEHGIEVNYAKSLKTLYQEVTLALINRSGNLDIICQNPFERLSGPEALTNYRSIRVPLPREDNAILPSWVADFGCPSWCGPSILFAQRSIFNAGKRSVGRPCRTVGREKNILLLQGSIIDSIGPMHQPTSNGDEPSSLAPDMAMPLVPQTELDEYSAWRILQTKSGLSSETSDPKGDLPPDQLVKGRLSLQPESSTRAFWRTIVKDCTAAPMMRRLTREEIEELDLINTECLQIGEDLHTCHQFHRSRPLSSYSHSRRKFRGIQRSKLNKVVQSSKLMLAPISYANESYMFTTTSNGLFVLTRRHVKEHDVIAVLDGGKVPVVLRRVEMSGDEHFEKLFHFVCIAYVHGIMDGEVEEAISRGWLQRQDIFIA